MEHTTQHIVIRSCGAISALGADEHTITKSYLSLTPRFRVVSHQQNPIPVASLDTASEDLLRHLVTASPQFRQLDRSVLMAIYATQQAARKANWLQSEDTQQDDLAVNIGSSRGATGLFEQHFTDFQQQQLSPSSSPTTTLGNLSSWAAHAVNAGGAQISHSITCSTALMAIANGIAWLRAGMAKRFLAGGTEAALTDFTIAQMKAIGIYSQLNTHPYPCQPFGTSGQNTFALGEGACVFALENCAASKLESGDIIIEAIGLGFEPITSKTGISTAGLNFQKSMRHALSQLTEGDQSVDVIITHSPGTRAGDKAELAAIKAVFDLNLPFITTNKHLIGHTLGASGALSLQYGMHLLQQQEIKPYPYPTSLTQTSPNKFKRVMINAAGFGGNAASLIIKLNQ